MRFLVASRSLCVLVCAGIRYPGMCVPKVLKSSGRCRVTGDRRTGIQVWTPGIFLSSGTLSAIDAMVWLHGSLLGENGVAINLSDCHRAGFFTHVRGGSTNELMWFIDTWRYSLCGPALITQQHAALEIILHPFLREHFVEVGLLQHTWYNKFLPLY